MSSKTSRTLLLASVFALGTAGFAGAQPAPGPGPGPQGAAPHHMHQMHHGQRGDGMMGFAAGEAFARADANNDGKVTRDEANAWLAARFAEIDANKDGGLTPDEIRAFYNARRGEGRGPPEGMRERMESHQAARFRFVDADLDGKIMLMAMVRWHVPKCSAVAGVAMARAPSSPRRRSLHRGNLVAKDGAS